MKSLPPDPEPESNNSHNQSQTSNTLMMEAPPDEQLDALFKDENAVT